MQLTKSFYFTCVCAIFFAYYAHAQSNPNGNASTTPTHVPVLDIKQILEIANPSKITSSNQTANLTTTSSVTSSTFSISSTVALPSSSLSTSPTTTATTAASTTTTEVTTPSTTTATTKKPTTTTTVPTTTSVPTTSTTTVSTSTSPATTQSSTTITSTGPPQALRERPPATNQTTTSESGASSTVTSEKPTLLSENGPNNMAPEPLRERPTNAPPTPQPTTSPTTTTKAPEVVRLGPIVRISHGEVRPAIQKSRGGKRYYAFRGIRYANPPTYFQRFKMPVPVSPWSDVLNATTYGPSCIQYNILSGQVEGEEDCLTLLPSGRNKKRGPGLYPVIVFFHQGAFMFGTSKDFEEKYMMDEPVVLVTVQYRLGAFGFLNTQGDSDAKGNQGLKDQVLALKFIRDNIQHFNGEPNLVTISGESAGAASVHYHLLSERSRGLFSRAISMSGTALSPWAFSRSPRKMAKKLGTFLNCPTTDMNELFACLQGHDARTIAEKTKDLYEWNTDPITPFAPSVEVEEDLNAFITESPYNLMLKGPINDATPWLLGVVENVCLLDAWSILVDKQLTDDLNIDWHRIAPTTFMYRDTALEPNAVSNQIRAYYFGTKDIGNDTWRELEHVYSDRYFNHGIRTTALMHVRTNEATPVYLYMFTYKGAQSHTKFAHVSDVLGVSEGDELRFLFNTNRFDDIPLDSADGEISQKFVKLWVSFARDGKPTEVWGEGAPEWKKISAGQVKGDEELLYYSLNKTCGFIDEPFSARLNFWDTLPLNENGRELQYSSIHQYPDDDIFDRYN